MSIVGTVRQQPNDVQDYDIDFDEWFPPEDVITSVVVTVSPSMPVAPSYAFTARVVKVWIFKGGTDGVTYQVTVRAITDDGREKEVELRVRIKEV